ncbi:MAG: 1-(5-phosphoribosyl)-5-[(5-phosphoribosylamino)methylideneamino]imidazole-4-carboxamide isomerase [Acidimicrobiales bacterium]
MSLDLYPAIDLRGGRCVRLYQGDYGRETSYDVDPAEQARAFAGAGAPWIHVVDLDAARTGSPVNRAVVGAIAAAVDTPVQTGGGVRSEAAAEALFEAGVARVVIGTAALEQPGLVRRLAARRPVAVGLDVRGREVAVRGWTQGSGRDVVEAVEELADAGVAAVIVTQIARDGTFEGPDLEGLALVLEATELDVIASGGVGELEHVRALAELRAGGRRLAGAIVGRALYEGRLDLAAALAVAAGRQHP